MPSGSPIPLDARATGQLELILKRIHALSNADALQLAAMPATWQFVAEALGWTAAPWYEPFDYKYAKWQIGFRSGANRAGARAGLEALAMGKPSLGNAARFLLSQFSGEALLGLRARVLKVYATPSNRARRVWWDRLPVPSPKDDVAVLFVTSVRAQWDEGKNASSDATKAAGHMTTGLLNRLDTFSRTGPMPGVEGEEPAPAVNRLFFSLSGTLDLSERILQPLRLRMFPIVANLITSVPLADQRSPAAVAAYVGQRIDGEMLHEAHRMLGSLQESLIGAMVVAGFPLTYWERLGAGAKPGPKLPSGRRTEFVESEFAAIHASLSAIVARAHRVLDDPATTRDAQGRKGIAAKALHDAGALGFCHISAIRLFWWVEACAALLDDPAVAASIKAQAMSIARRDTGASEIITALLEDPEIAGRVLAAGAIESARKKAISDLLSEKQISEKITQHAIAEARSDPSNQIIREILKDPSVVSKVSEKAMDDARKGDGPALKALLDDPAITARICALAVAEVRRGGPALRSLLGDRAVAARLSAMVMDDARRGGPSLLSLLDDPAVAARICAQAMAEARRGGEAVATLLGDPAVAARLSAMVVAEAKRGGPVLTALLDDPEVAKKISKRAMADARRDCSNKTLMALLDDREVAAKLSAQALADARKKGGSEALLALLDDPAVVAILSTQAMTDARREGGSKRLKALLDDPDVAAKLSARALADARREGGSEALLALLDDPEVAAILSTQAMVEARREGGSKRLKALLADPEVAARLSAQALADARRDGGSETLRALLDDRAVAAKLSAQAMAEVRRKGGSKRLKALLDDPDVAAKLSARALADARREGGSEALLALLDDPEVAAILSTQAMVEARREGGSKRLKALLADPHVAARLSAQALADARRDGGSETLRALLDDRAVAARLSAQAMTEVRRKGGSKQLRTLLDDPEVAARLSQRAMAEARRGEGSAALKRILDDPAVASKLATEALRLARRDPSDRNLIDLGGDPEIKAKISEKALADARSHGGSEALNALLDKPEIASKVASRAMAIAQQDCGNKRLLALLNDPEVAEKLSAEAMAAARRDCAKFSAAAAEINGLLHFVLAHNHGLSGSLHVQFMRKNQSFAKHDSKDVASLVREEMLKAAASFDYTIGWRFSTYATSRVTRELRRRPHQERQLIKLSPDQTTAQPRVWQLAAESEMQADNPGYFRDIAERYNRTYTETGRAPLTATQVEDLIRIGRSAPIGPTDSDDDDGRAPLQLADTAPAQASKEVTAELAKIVRSILDDFTPAEELTLAVLLRATPPEEALGRFSRSSLSDAQTKISRLIASKAVKQEGGGVGLAGRRVKLTRGVLSERAVRTKQGDEQARKDRRAGPDASTD